MSGGVGSPQGWLAGPAPAQTGGPWLEGGRSHGNHCSPSVASDNLPCASGSVTPPPRCQAMLAEFVLMSGVGADAPWIACP